MEDLIIFNHIPRTGGTSLRVILNRIYGESRVFFINSRDIPSSLEQFNTLSEEEKRSYKVISGHGAMHFQAAGGNIITVSILREPVNLFLSQYHYLRKSKNSNFLNEVSKLSSLEEYLEYAIEKGQDNMMVRCLDPENNQFSERNAIVPQMEISGEEMLARAKRSLHDYDAVLDLHQFNKHLYELASILKWKRIPLFRPLNKSIPARTSRNIDNALRLRMEQFLRYDIDLYNYYMDNIAEFINQDKNRGIRYRTFLMRQFLISLASRYA